MAALDEAIRAEREVPREFIEAGKAAFTWHSIDTELAALTFDSATETTLAMAVRAQEASPRFLTFSAAELTIELEIGPDEIIGQIVPPRPGHVAPAPFRLHCPPASGARVLTTGTTRLGSPAPRPPGGRPRRTPRVCCPG
jgi:hypothetical protein